MGKSILDREGVKRFLRVNRGYLKKGSIYLANKLHITPELAKISQQEVRQEIKIKGKVIVSPVLKQEVLPSNYFPCVFIPKHQNVLVIGDLHAPWILPNYLEWCYNLSKEYKTNKTIFIGDVIDSHSWSFHEHNVDGMSVGDELEAAKKQLKLAYDLFPEAEITLGNHDLLIARKARAAGLSQKFIRDLGEVLEAPKTWRFEHSFKYHDVNYIHGSVGNAFKRATESRTSTVQGHLHSQAFVQYSVSEKDAVFGLQIGCGLDHKAYAFDYAVPMTKKPIISAGVVLDNGNIPILRLMKL